MSSERKRGLRQVLLVCPCVCWENVTRLFSCQAKIKKESKEEEHQFLQAITKFNTDFSLTGNSAAVLESQTHAEILALRREAETLLKGHKNCFVPIQGIYFKSFRYVFQSFSLCFLSLSGIRDGWHEKQEQPHELHSGGTEPAAAGTAGAEEPPERSTQPQLAAS